MTSKPTTHRFSRWLRDLEERLHHGSLADRIREARERAPDIERSRGVLSVECGELMREWLDWNERWTGKPGGMPSMSRESAARGRFWQLAGWACALSEAGIAGLVARFWLAVPWWLLVPVAVLIVGVVTWICEIGWRVLHDEALPSLAYRRTKRALFVLIAIVLSAMGGFLGLRMLPIVGMVALAAQGILSVLLPVAAGGCFYLAHLSLFGNRLIAALRKREEILARVEAVREMIEELSKSGSNDVTHTISMQPDTGDVSAEAPVAGLQVAPARMRVSTAVIPLAFALASLAAFGQTNTAGPGSPAVEVSAGPVAPGDLVSTETDHAPTGGGDAPIQRVDLWVDTSGSADPQESGRVLQVFGETAPGIPGLREIAVFHFALERDAWQGPAAHVELPHEEPFLCSRTISEVGTYLASVRKEHEELCSRDAMIAHAAFERRLEKFRAEWERLVGGLDLARAAAPRTCLFQVLLRAQGERPGVLTVILTDGGQYDCPSSVDVDQHSPRSRVAIVLVASRTDDRDVFGRAHRRADRLRGALPWLEVIPSFQIENAFDILSVPVPKHRTQARL